MSFGYFIAVKQTFAFCSNMEGSVANFSNKMRPSEAVTFISNRPGIGKFNNWAFLKYTGSHTNIHTVPRPTTCITCN